jgi:hypothetical protein
MVKSFSSGARPGTNKIGTPRAEKLWNRAAPTGCVKALLEWGTFVTAHYHNQLALSLGRQLPEWVVFQPF